jgi:predicted negative regulator of RcsB-dependent stress response
MITRSILLAITLVASPLCFAQNPGPEEGQKFVRLMSDYLQLADQVVDVASHREAAVFLALEGIFEVYEKRHDAPSAVTHFQRLLKENSGNPTVKNLIRFKLKDIYKKTGQTDKALEQLELIIKENAAP